jgi:hypothetical protein
LFEFLTDFSASSLAGAKDRMGHQIHQMYTARRIQRYEQLYGWRPLKFRIEAFVNGFVDLVSHATFETLVNVNANCISSLSPHTFATRLTKHKPNCESKKYMHHFKLNTNHGQTVDG